MRLGLCVYEGTRSVHEDENEMQQAATKGGMPPRRRGVKASDATATRYDSVACDERNFSSSEERALAPLALALQRSTG